MTFRRASEVMPATINWLWRSYIPFGALTVVEGDPATGKSRLMYSMAAGLSSGTVRPSPSGGRGAVIVSAEDDYDRTIVPALTSAGADLDQISGIGAAEFAGDPIVLPRDLVRLHREIDSVDAGMVILDPLPAILGVRMTSDQQVRQALGPVAELAAYMQCAIIGIRHLAKSTRGNPLYAGSGSIGISAAARSVLRVAVDPRDRATRVVAPIKSSLGPLAVPQAFTLERAYADEAPRVIMLGPSELSIEDIIGVVGDRRPIDHACEVLQVILGCGPVPVTEIGAAVRRAGVSWGTARRAKYLLGVRSLRRGFGPGAEWAWALRDGETAGPAEPMADREARLVAEDTVDE